MVTSAQLLFLLCINRYFFFFEVFIVILTIFVLTDVFKRSEITKIIMVFFFFSTVNDYNTFGHPLKGNMSVHSSVMSTTRKKFQLGNDITVHDEQQNYMALCRGEKLRVSFIPHSFFFSLLLLCVSALKCETLL